MGAALAAFVRVGASGTIANGVGLTLLKRIVGRFMKNFTGATGGLAENFVGTFWLSQSCLVAIRSRDMDASQCFGMGVRL